MRIKFLGLTIETGADHQRLPPPQPEPVKASTSTAVSTVVHEPAPDNEPVWGEEKKVNIPKLMKIPGLMHPLTKAVDWPKPNDDPWQRSMLMKGIMEFNRFSIDCKALDYCSIRNLVKDLAIPLDHNAEIALEYLNKLHCMKYSHMDPEVYRSIPALINTVLNNASYLHFDGVVKDKFDFR